MLIIGFDPGGMTKPHDKAHSGTGVAVLSLTDKVELLEHRIVNWDEWTMGGMAQHYVSTYTPDKVVVENFKPRWGQKFELDSVFLIGAIRASVQPDELKLVMPSAHKSLIPRAWAKQIVLDSGYKIGEGHGVDAVSLCLYYGITQQNKTLLEEFKKWKSK